MYKNSVYKIFTASLLITSYLQYSLRSYISVVPLLFSLLLLVISEVVKPSKMSLGKWLTFLMWVPYSALATIYYLNHPYLGMILHPVLITNILLPFIIFALLRIKQIYSIKAFGKFVFNTCYLFLICQLVVCVGQLSTYILGIGLPVSPDYSEFYMVTGTLTNSNDVACLTLFGAFCVSKTEKFVMQKYKVLIVWITIILILLIVQSRSAIVMTLVVFMFSREIENGKKISQTVGMSMLLLFIIPLMYFGDNNSALGLMINRLESLVTIYNNGINSDQSINVRSESYVYFLGQLDKINLGSGKIYDYLEFSTQANFDSSLMFHNPHSLIVELGYWMGWPGLITFFLPFITMVYIYQRNILFVILAIVSMHISSSVLGSFYYFLFLMMSILVSNSKQLEGKRIEYTPNNYSSPFLSTLQKPLNKYNI